MTYKFCSFFCDVEVVKISLRVIATTKVIIVEKQAYDIQSSYSIKSIFLRGEVITKQRYCFIFQTILLRE